MLTLMSYIYAASTRNNIRILENLQGQGKNPISTFQQK